MDKRIGARGAAAAAVVVCAVLAAAPAAAGTYRVGAGIGQVDWDDASGLRVPDPDDPGMLVLGAVDDSDTTYKVWVARKMWSTFDLELAWHDWGSLSNTVTGVAGTSSASADATAFSLSALGRWPVTEHVDILFRLGWYRWETEVEGTAVASDDDGTELSWGLGVDVLATRRLAVRVEWEKLEDIDFFQGDVYTVGLAWSF